MKAREDACGEARAGWAALLDLQFATRGSRTCLTHRAHRGPLIVQRPFYPEGPVCHVYVVHPPGGVVGGDRLELRISAQAGSHVLITTPAAGKFYRSTGLVAHSEQHIRLERATLEWLPQETIFFPHSRARVKTHVQLCEQSRFIGWDIACYGRPASGLAFDAGEIFQCLELWSGDQPLLIDRVRLDGGAGTMRTAFGLNGSPVLGTFVAHPADENMLEAARRAKADAVTFACTRVGSTLMCRAVASQVDALRKLFQEIWAQVRPGVTGRSVCMPRIWAV
jgi:urease accessory protein